MRIDKAESISNAITCCLDLMSDLRQLRSEKPYVWFRGVGSKAHQLQPGVFWKKCIDKEQDAFLDLHQVAAAYENTSNFKYWDIYFLAQHYGLPTRLLDWTENFFNSVYFALDSWTREPSTSVPAIWVIEPCLLNKLSINWEGIIAPIMNQESSLWLPPIGDSPRETTASDGHVYRNEHPLAIYPKMSNKRIIAQQGVFTVHGVSAEPIDSLICSKYQGDDTCVFRIDLEFPDCQEEFNQFKALGMRHSSIYPELDSYVRDLKELYEIP